MVAIFTGGINNRHDLTRANAADWPTVATHADGFYLHPNGWFDAAAGMGSKEIAARSQLLDNFRSKRFIVEDSFDGVWSAFQKGNAAMPLRHINGMVANKLSVQSLRPEYVCVGWTPNVDIKDMIALDPDVLAKRFADATKVIRDAGIPVYWLWTPVSRPAEAIKVRALVPGSTMQKWEYMAVKGLASGVSFDIPPGHVMQNGGPTKVAIDWYMHEMIPRCRARKLKTIWLCNVIHSSQEVFSGAVERIIANNAMADTLIPTNFGSYTYPATPEVDQTGKANTQTTSGTVLWALQRLRGVSIIRPSPQPTTAAP